MKFVAMFFRDIPSKDLSRDRAKKVLEETRKEQEEQKRVSAGLYVPQDREDALCRFFSAQLRRPMVSSAHVEVQRFLDPKERWKWIAIMLGFTGSAVVLGVIAGSLGSMAMPDRNQTAIELERNDTAESASGLQMGHWTLLGLTQVLVTIQALLAHAEVFFAHEWHPRRIKRSVSMGLSVLASTTINGLFCAAHCSSDPQAVKPYLLSAWISYAFGHAVLSSHLGVRTAVITDFPDDEKVDFPFSSLGKPSREACWYFFLACFMPAHCGAVSLPRQLVHNRIEERQIDEKWGLHSADLRFLVFNLIVLGAFGLAMIIVCNNSPRMEDNHWLGLATLIASLPALLRRSLELTRHTSVRPFVGWLSQSTFSFSAMMMACMTQGWGFAASLIVLSVWASSSTFSVSVERKARIFTQRFRGNDPLNVGSSGLELSLLVARPGEEAERNSNNGTYTAPDLNI